MDDFLIYITIGTLMFFIGVLLGYLLMNGYYRKRFLVIAKECEKAETIVPLIAELERES